MSSDHLVWATDLHLDHVDGPQRHALRRKLHATGARAVVLTGDISEASSLIEHLEEIGSELSAPLYFVLGNHDFYGSSVGRVRELMRASFSRGAVRYLHGGWVTLGEVVLVGVDGWGDARLGDVSGTDLMLNDFRYIHDLQEGLRSLEETGSRELLHQRLRELGDESAQVLRQSLSEATQVSRRLVILTHVPPFAAACWYKGATEHPRWHPYFTCKAVGEVLVDIAERYPSSTFEVLCGHTHGRGQVWIRPNLRVRTGAAEYGAPELQPLVRIGDG